jgi:integrase
MKHLDYFALVKDYLATRRNLGFSVERIRWLGTSRASLAASDTAVRSRLISPCDGLCPHARPTRHAPNDVSGRFGNSRVTSPRSILPPRSPRAGLFGRVTRRSQPHIYSDAEITALLKECGRLQPRYGLRPRTYVALFSLLASTGLRLSEACHLHRHDVDLCKGLLTIREGKFRKSRLVPLHPTAVQALTGYVARHDACRGAQRSEFFFHTDRTPALKRATVEKTFSRLRDRLGWTMHGRARRPRIHDLRHTFAVRRLLRWYEEGVEASQKILVLATYLGHAKVTDTYWYLSAVPELMAVTAQRFEHLAQPQQESVS